MNQSSKQSKTAERQSASWDISNAPKNYLSLIFTQGGSAFFAFASVLIISNKIGAEGYGGVVAIIAASQVAQILVNWTSVTVVRFAAEEFVDTGRIARAFWMRLLVLVPNLLIVISTGSLWYPWLAERLKLTDGLFWFVVLHFVANAFWIHVQFALQGAKLPRIQGWLLMIERLLIFAGISGLALSGTLSPLAALLCYAVIPLVMALTGSVYLRSLIFVRFNVDWRIVKEMIAYSLPLLPVTLFGYASGNYVDAIFVSELLSTRDLGIYAVATQISGIALQVPTLANSLLIPMFITLQKETDSNRMNNYFKDVLPVLVLLWGVGCTFLGLVGHLAVPLFFGSEYSPVGLPLWILLAASVVGIPVVIGYSALSHSTSATYMSLLAALFSGAGNIVGNFILIPRLGMAGCAWATFIAYFLSVATFAFLLRRSAQMPVSWTLIAALPSLSGALIFTYSLNPWLSVFACLSCSFIVGYLFRNSLQKTILFLKNIRERQGLSRA